MSSTFPNVTFNSEISSNDHIDTEENKMSVYQIISENKIKKFKAAAAAAFVCSPCHPDDFIFHSKRQ